MRLDNKPGRSRKEWIYQFEQLIIKFVHIHISSCACYPMNLQIFFSNAQLAIFLNNSSYMLQIGDPTIRECY